jgi:tripartite-type tricarboxylate transporter receptor subunit TctC
MKTPTRRAFLGLAAGVVALPALADAALVETYPARPVHIVVGFPPGGSADIVARLIGQWLSRRLGQRVVIENRPGASGNIATEATAHAEPDGYTLLLATAANAINATLFGDLNFNFIRDFAPVGSISRNPLVMLVHPSVTVNSLDEFVAYAKANPGKINMGSAGNGTPHHLAGELFMMMTGTVMLHVPYRGEAPALTDLIGGQVQVMFTPIGSALGYIESGKLHALAVTSPTRMNALPNVPTMEESVPRYEASGWFGICAPKITSAGIVERLNGEINAGLADPEIKARLAELGLSVLSGSPTDFGKHIANDTEKWGKVIRAANIKAG